MAPVLDLSRGTKTMKCLNELEKSQWWSRDKVLELQNQRLRQLVQHAYDNVPYYRRLFDDRALRPSDIENAKDLVKLPALNKRLIRSNFDSLMAPGFPAKEMIPNCTAGSTGEPLRFYSTKNDLYNWGFAAAQRGYGWAGYEIGDKCVLVWRRRTSQTTMGRIRNVATEFFERAKVLDLNEMSVEDASIWARKLEDFQPKFIRGYPNVIYLLARFIQREGKTRLRPRAIITTSEQLQDYQRDLFREVFGCEVYSHYTSWEIHAIATECPEHSGYHIAAENVIVEVVDDEDKPVPAGEEGRILVTNLHNYAMPFIRYDIGDIGAISDQACPCGRGLPLLAKLSGRAVDAILTKSGRIIQGAALPWRFLISLGIEQFQIVQESYEKVVVRIVLDREHRPSRADGLAEEIASHYRTALGEDMDIAVEIVDEIPATKAGKTRVVISNLADVSNPLG